MNPHVPPVDRRRWFKAPLLWTTLLLFSVYLVLVLLRPPDVFWSLDEGGKLLYMQNVVQTGSVTAPIVYPGRTLDPALSFLPLFYWAQEGSQIYSWWPVGFPLLTLPFFQWLGWIGLYVIPALAGAVCATLAALIAQRLVPGGRSTAIVTAFVVGVATPILFYSTMFWEHTLSVALLLLALWLALVSAETGQKWPALAAGAAAALAGFLRTEQLFAAFGILAVLLLWRRRQAILMGVALGAITCGWLSFNLVVMGAALSRQWGENNTTLTRSIFPGLQEAGALFIPYVLFNAPKIIAFDLGAGMLALATGLTVLALVLPFVRRLWWLLPFVYLGLAAICSWVLFQPTGYRTVHGLLLIAPHIVCFPWLFRGLSHERARQWPALMIGVTALFVFVAFLARSWLAAVAGLGNLRRQQPGGMRFLLVAYLALVAVGFGFEVRGQQAVWTTVQNYRATQLALRQMDTTPKLTACIWLPMVIPELYWRGDTFASHGQDDSVEDWRVTVQQHGATATQTFDVDMCLNVPLDEIARLRKTNPAGIVVHELNQH